MKFRRALQTLIQIIALFAMIAICFLLPNRIPHPYPPGSGGGAVYEFTVISGMSASQTADAMVASGICKEKKWLLYWIVRMGIDRSIRPGIYRLHAASPWEVAVELASSRPKPFRRTIIPGHTFGQIFARHEDAGRAALMDDSLYPAYMRELLPRTPEDRIAFLMPDTYSVPPGDAAGLVRAASAEWWRKVGKDAAAMTHSPEEILRLATLASLVEREVKHDDERPIVAGVFVNRLGKRMPLQSCASVVYAWILEGVQKTALLYKDLKIDSPYNTYIHAGLPPGPVGVPGLVSWRAAMRPANTGYMFFVLGKNGRHIFTSTYGEHMEAVKRTKQP